ncbi:MAG: hypothetical protein EOP67_21310, partial [Sphingomonas sp.]
MIARLLALLLALLPVAALAQAPGVTADPILHRRADALVGILATGEGYERYFAESFRAKVPRSKPITRSADQAVVALNDSTFCGAP